MHEGTISEIISCELKNSREWYISPEGSKGKEEMQLNYNLKNEKRKTKLGE